MCYKMVRKTKKKEISKIDHDFAQWYEKDRQKQEKYREFLETIKGLDFLPKSEAWLTYVACNIEGFAEQEALVYLRSRGKICKKQIDDLIIFWRKAEHYMIQEYADGILEVGRDISKPRRIGKISFEEAQKLIQSTDPTFGFFWGARDSDEDIIDVIMLRTVEWCKIGGFEDWWQRLASIIYKRDLKYGIGDQGATSAWLFSMCRSDFAISLMGKTMKHNLETLHLVDDGLKYPWEMQIREDYRTEGTVHFLVFLHIAAAIIFANARLTENFQNAKFVKEAGQTLLKFQLTDGSWHYRSDIKRGSIEMTSIALHSIMLLKPFGWENAVDRAKKWLMAQQNEFGFWEELSGRDVTYLTVLALDAIALTNNEKTLTFTLPDDFKDQPRSMFPISENPLKKFKIGLSFPGEYRTFIEGIAEQLQVRLGEGTIFYDKFFQAELARPDLDTTLQKIYSEDCELIVVLLCPEYEDKEWCGLEWRVVRDLIKRKMTDKIMFLKIGEIKPSIIPGLLSIDGYIDADNHSLNEIVDLILTRYDTLHRIVENTH